METLRQLAEKVIRVCCEIAACSEEPDRITRTFLSPPMHEVHRILRTWMQQLGMSTTVDAAGNLRGVWKAVAERRIAIGSHVDTVPDAGPFDGVLGVVLGIALVESVRPQVGVEVIGFSEEEGVRFGLPFIGSRAVVGTLDETAIARISGAVREFGLEPRELPKALLNSKVRAYLEFHIEQGPVLESLGVPLAVVNAIAGQSRTTVQFTGNANHAGTTPMLQRQDALAGCAEWILEVERYASSLPGIVATVGKLAVAPNASNVIAGAVQASLDVRSAHDSARALAVQHLLDKAGEICERRDLTVSFEPQLEQPAVQLNAGLTENLARAVSETGYPLHRMASGAGHDAMILAPHVPSAMLFLRSPGGISHHPDEDVLVEDVEAALRVGREFLARV